MGVSTMATKTKTRKAQTEITAPVIHRIVDKLSKHCYGYLVASDSQPGHYYQVTWDRTRHEYECNGAKCGFNKPCKHIRAVQSVCQSKKLLAAPRRLVAFFAALATYTQQQATQQAVAEAEQVVQPVPERYCEVCKCVGKLHLAANGLRICDACSEQTPVAVATTKPVIATKTAQLAKTKAPTVVTRGNAPLGSNRVFSLTR